jgi:chromosome partitioning protein
MILAFVSRKGGVGKTTSVVSLGGALVRLGHKVLIVDLDSQASASLSLGFQRAQLAPSIHDVLFRRMSLADAVRPTGIDRLEVVTASADLLAADLDLQNLRRRDELLADALRPHVERWDWILLDCPPSLTGIVRNALIAADGWVLPTPPHFLAYEGVDVLIDAADRLLRRFGRRDAFAGLLLTMIDYRTSAARAHAAELRLRYGLKVFDTEIPVNVRLAESPLAGRTIFESDPKAAGAHAYRMLAVELLDRFRAGRDEAAASPTDAAASEPASGRSGGFAELPTPSDQPN